MLKSRLLILAGVLAFTAGCAKQSPAPKAAPVASPTLTDSSLAGKSPEDVITARLEKARPDIKISSVRPAPIAGLYAAQVTGGPVIYVTPEGDKFIAGDVFTVGERGFAKWEDPAIMAERKQMLATIDPKDSIIFKPKGETKAVVYVFTDVDCGYCRKLNSQMADYNALGIEIRYLAFPRTGIPSPSADKLVTAWCSADRQKALTLLKEDMDVPAATCKNPVATEYELGNRLGVNGTPALWMPNGELKPGYLPPAELAKELGIN